MRADVQCAVGPPFHRRPPAAKMAAPRAGGSRSVATAAKMAALHTREPIMGSRRPGGSLPKWRERRYLDVHKYPDGLSTNAMVRGIPMGTDPIAEGSDLWAQSFDAVA